MSRYLILGDLHCREIWKDIVAKEADSCDKIIFLGDYTVPREIKLDDPTDACGFLYEVLDYKDQNPDKVILLRGNHDNCSLGYYWARCYPKDHPKVCYYWQTDDVKNWFLNNTQWVYCIPDTNIVCSHAGISTRWEGYLKAIDEDRIGDPMTIFDVINTFPPSELFGFTDDNPFDTYGESKTQPCTWIRPYTLMQYGLKGFIQVVGHTRVDHICNLKEEEIKCAEDLTSVKDYTDVWCCDCLEHGEYLIIEDGEFKPCKL